VGGDAAVYVPRLQYGEDVDVWAAHAASVLQQLLNEPADERLRRTERGRHWAAGFDADKSIAAYLEIYGGVLRTCSGREGQDLLLGEGR
jgi:hypothetical protein